MSQMQLIFPFEIIAIILACYSTIQQIGKQRLQHFFHSNIKFRMEL